MEEAHHTHKEPAWGWLAALAEWRRSRTRRALTRERHVVTPWSLRAYDDWTA